MDKVSHLSDFVNIIAGITFSSSMVDPKGAYPVINATALSANATISDFGNSQKIKELPVRSQAVIQNDDVVIVSRAMPGSTFKASLIKTNIPLLATNSIYILRQKTNRILPEYLNYHLNSKAFQKQFLVKIKGGTVMHITKLDLADTALPVPTMETQEKIVKFYQNLLMQKKIQQEQMIIKEEIFEATFLNLYKHDNSDHSTRA